LPDKTKDGETYEIPCIPMQYGSTIRVTAMKPEYLHLAEVEVFGPVEKCDPVGS
jgi:hypothetical protein